MTEWTYRLDLKNVFHDESLTFVERRDEIVKRIRTSDFYDAEAGDDLDLDSIVDWLSNAEDVAAFDEFWTDFYDWCDDNRVWVGTF